MAQSRIYQSSAQRQAAYRQRLAQRQAMAGSDSVVTRLAELERAVAAAGRRADQAETRAARADRQLAATRQAQRAATDQVTALEATVADLRRQLAAGHRHATPAAPAIRQPTPASPTDPEGRPMNRAQRRRAQRQQPRPR